MAAASDVDLRAWIREHHVRWDSAPHRERAHDGVQVVGYDLTLTARPPEESHGDPGGSAAFAVFAGLQRVALSVVPADSGAALTTEPFEPVFHLRRQGEWQPEIQLTIGVRHSRGDYFAPADDQERGWLHRVEKALADLGAPHA
jgi:hypothetical protein